jgi:asparagine synthase (glutamine-hydrolysing)
MTGSHGSLEAVLLEQFEHKGTAALLDLHGWFNGVIIDLRQQQAILFNDRYGLGRIYLHQVDNCISFSSDAKSLLNVLPATRQLDPRGLAEWLTCGCVLQNRTLFKDIELLPPGSAWTFSHDGRVTKHRYFDPRTWESQPMLAPEEYYQQLKELFPRVLKRYINGPEPVAMSLTGGLDGRMIMAWANRPAGGLPCYTFNGTVRDCADVKLARKVARVCGQPHQTIVVGGDFLQQFQNLAEKCVYETDGAMDVTGAAELYVNRLAREVAPVRLTGNYGSEILRRYVAFRPRRFSSELLAPEMGEYLRAAEATYASETRCHPLSFIAFKQVPWHHFARFAAERSAIDVRSPFLDNDLVRLAFQAPAETAGNVAPSLRLIVDGKPELGKIPTDRGLTWPVRSKANFLKRQVSDFLTKAEYAYDYGMPDWLARLDNYVAPLKIERLFLGHQKFCHFRSWYQQDLAGQVRELLLSRASARFAWIKAGVAEELTRAHLRRAGNHTLALHKLMSLELIERKLLGN